MSGGAAIYQVCNATTPCESSLTCLLDARNIGFCSRACTVDADCALGYTGPGIPGCVLNSNMACALACGAAFQIVPDGPCPSGLTCGDANNHGESDICLPP
jgi:hypothetical protein